MMAEGQLSLLGIDHLPTGSTNLHSNPQNLVHQLGGDYKLSSLQDPYGFLPISVLSHAIGLFIGRDEHDAKQRYSDYLNRIN
jgi:hypothetical protein